MHLALGLALVVMVTGANWLPADSLQALVGVGQIVSLGHMLTSIISPLLVFAGKTMILLSSLSARKIPGIF